MLNGRRQEAETLAICSAISTDSMNPMPLPPSSSGNAQEKKPSSPILATRSGAELVLALLLLERRRDFLGGESLGRVLNQPLLFVQFEIHSCPVSRHRNRRILDDRFVT